MHEFSIAAAIVENVLAFADKERATRVLEVRLTIGEFTHIEQEQLRFCFQSITHATALEEAALEIETSNAAVRCPHCGYAGPPKYWDGALAGASVPTLQCPDMREGRANPPKATNARSRRSNSRARTKQISRKPPHEQAILPNGTERPCRSQSTT